MSARWTVGMMAWRIGDALDVHEQIEWIRQSGFGGVGFHASAGTPGQWQGIDPSATGGEARARLREEISRFAMREVHAPVTLQLKQGALDETIDAVVPVLEFARDAGATIVTVHAKPPTSTAGTDSSAWPRAAEHLNGIAVEHDLTIGLEVTEGFEWIAGLGLSNAGVTLDVGHMYHHGGKPLEPYGTLGEVVRRLGAALVHLHIHDHNGMVDHVELGTGIIGFGDLFAALKEVGYKGGLCLELNPDRAAPEGILRSRDWLTRRIHESGAE